MTVQVRVTVLAALVVIVMSLGVPSGTKNKYSKYPFMIYYIDQEVVNQGVHKHSLSRNELDVPLTPTRCRPIT